MSTLNVAIIAAGGRGERLGGGRAKQFRALAGVPVIIHTLRRFERATTIGEVIVVLPAADAAGFLSLAGQHGLRKLSRVVTGGPTRGESVYRGLRAVRAETAEIIAVHDGVRPFVTPAEIDLAVREARQHGAAILAAPAVDTIKEVREGRIVRTLERRDLRHALTPQCFRYDLLRRAYEEALAAGTLAATDDSALVERTGVTVRVVEGHPRNIKITRPEDLALAETLLQEFEERCELPDAGSD